MTTERRASADRTMLPLTAPGVYAGISLADYHSGGICDGPSVSSSGTRRLWAGAPSDFFAHWECNPQRVEPESTKALNFGSAAHHLLLGEDDFSTRYIARPDELPDADGKMKPWQGNRTVCREWLAAQEAVGKVVITKTELTTIKAMARSLSEHPLVEQGLLAGEVERTMVARDPETGLWMRGKPDNRPMGGDYCDLKTIAEGRTVAAIASIANY